MAGGLRGHSAAARPEFNRISFPTIVLAATPASQVPYGAGKWDAAPVRRGPRFPRAEEGAAGGWKALCSLLPCLWPSGAPSLRLRVLLALTALVAAKSVGLAHTCPRRQQER